MRQLPVKNFWREQAKKFKFDVKAVNFDPLEEELELHFLKNLIKDGETVFDLGCGNGRTLLELAAHRKNSRFYGADSVKEMIDVAKKAKNSAGITNARFYKLDATSPDVSRYFDFKFDKVLSKRLLINLKGDSKYRAIDNIHKVLKSGGRYVMVECFIEPLNRINKIRRHFGLEEIKVKFFNEYLSAEFLKSISGKFSIEKKLDFESLYYFSSRIFNAKLSKGNPDYHAPINRMAVDMIKKGINPIKGYSPEIALVLKKI